ncbi:MAG: hypothetical protein AB7K68_14865 [Bacteriovoracia bacterium]
MGCQIEIVIRGQKAGGETLSLFLEPTEIPLAKRWTRELKRVLRGPHILEKDQSFCGFPQSARNEALLCAELNRTCEIIRNFRGPGVWQQGYKIEEIASTENLSNDLLNAYHHHFEMLRGQAWDPSPYYLAAQKFLDVDNAIRQLNVLVHQLEGIMQSRKLVAAGERFFPFSVFHFLTPDSDIRLPLHDEDYDYFSFEEDFGLVQMLYCQVGKTHYQAWCDGDKGILEDYMNNLRYYTSGFMISWGEFTKGIKSSDLFLQWLKESGTDLRHRTYFYDRKGNKQGLGFLNVARVPFRQFGSRSVREVQELLAQYDDVYKVRVHENGKVVEHSYEYRLSDPNYQQIVAHRFNSRNLGILPKITRPLKKTSIYRMLMRQ